MKNTIKYKIGQTYDGAGEVKGIKFKLLLRKGDDCLFERTDGYYEIIKLRQQKRTEKEINGRKFTLEAKEIYPKGDSWDGKCIKSYKTAVEEFSKERLN